MNTGNLGEYRSLRAERDNLRKAALDVIEMNRTEALHRYGDAEKAEGWACVRALREALDSAGERQ